MSLCVEWHLCHWPQDCMMHLYISGLLCDNASFLYEQITRSSVMTWRRKGVKMTWRSWCVTHFLYYIYSLTASHHDESSEQLTTSSGTKIHTPFQKCCKPILRWHQHIYKVHPADTKLSSPHSVSDFLPHPALSFFAFVRFLAHFSLKVAHVYYPPIHYILLIIDTSRRFVQTLLSCAWTKKAIQYDIMTNNCSSSSDSRVKSSLDQHSPVMSQATLHDDNSSMMHHDQYQVRD